MTQIIMVTNKGEINLNLFDDDAAITVASFLHLVNQGFYNGIVFHRVIKDFMIQVGCPLVVELVVQEIKVLVLFLIKDNKLVILLEMNFKAEENLISQGS